MGKIYQLTTNGKNIANGRKICTTNGHKIYQYLLLQDPPKFTQIGIFGLKMHHLATLVLRHLNFVLLCPT
jgi:hypothetical protein